MTYYSPALNSSCLSGHQTNIPVDLVVLCSGSEAGPGTTWETAKSSNPLDFKLSSITLDIKMESFIQHVTCSERPVTGLFSTC